MMAVSTNQTHVVQYAGMDMRMFVMDVVDGSVGSVTLVQCSVM